VNDFKHKRDKKEATIRKRLREKEEFENNIEK